MRDLRMESRRKIDILDRKALLDALNKYKDAYQAAHPQTADSDFVLVGAYCTGLSAAHVALDHHCAESTVYRALTRAREFLQHQDIGDRWKPLIEHIMEHSISWESCESGEILNMIFETFRAYNDMDDAQIKSEFQKLNTLLENLGFQEQDLLINAVCDLCHSHQRTGFTVGVKVGIRLGEELRT